MSSSWELPLSPLLRAAISSHTLGTTTKEAVMSKVVNCDCGETVQGESDDELVANVTAHVEARHPELVGTMSREDVLAMAEED
jgi:predicted small metal-binding protein